MQMLTDVLATNPAVNHQLSVPRVVEAVDAVINLDEPFTLELPAMISDSYTDVLLVFVNADGSFSPQAVVQGTSINNVPTRGVVDNSKLSPPFNRDHVARVRCFIRLRQTDIWQRSPDSMIYSF